MKSDIKKMIKKSKNVDKISDSLLYLFTYLSYAKSYSLGVCVNCTVYKSGIAVFYLYFSKSSIQLRSTDQCGNPCPLFYEFCDLLPSKSQSTPIHIFQESEVFSLIDALNKLSIS